jgi:hypothetical protein
MEFRISKIYSDNTSPNALSINTYIPAEAGMAVASSDFDKAAGKTQIPDKR